MSAADLLADAFAAIPGLADRLDRLVQAAERQAAHDRVAAAVADGLHPDHAYSSRQTAQFLGIEPASVAKISPELLPRVRSARFLGIDILAYRGDVTQHEATSYKTAKRDRVRSVRPAAPGRRAA